MILNDKQITTLATHKQLITPFVSELIREQSRRKVLSYGLSSYGYDIRLSSSEFKIFQHVPGTIVNPKAFDSDNLRNVELHNDEYGNYFVLPAHSYGLGVALEKISMPNNVTAIAIGKSTYARCGIICNLTPIESGWNGHLTIEISNSSGADCRIYANEGICQLLFFRGDICEVSYQQRDGKYQNQLEQITVARI